MDLTATFDESVRVSWDYMKDKMADQYNTILARCQEQMAVYRDKIHKFEKLCEDGNITEQGTVYIKLNELTANDVVGKLLIVELDPEKIWAALTANYGAGFFKNVIERELGVTTDYKDKLLEEFSQKVLSTTYTVGERLTELERKVRRQVQRLTQQHDEAVEEVATLTNKL